MRAAPNSGEIILALAEELTSGDLLFLADDDQQAEVVAMALAALMPTHHVVFLPSSDTLPGDSAPASPANIGQRVAALRALRQLNRDAERSSLATIMSGEAAARLYADPSAFDAAPPVLHEGQEIDTAVFAAQMEAIGYYPDDRVDEPGEIAVRGSVIDIYPADAGLPARIDVTQGHISSIRQYDPVTQLSEETLNSLAIGRAAEPTSAAEVTILRHLPPSRIYMSEQANIRRERFIRLAREAASASRDEIDAAEAYLWQRDLAAWSLGSLSFPQTTPVPRFAEQRAPLSALKQFASPHMRESKRLLLVGCERDIRFLRNKLEKTFQTEVTAIDALDTIRQLPAGANAALVAPIDQGAICGDIVMIAAADLLGSRALIGQSQQSSGGLPIGSRDAQIDDLVVHEEHGIARVMGLEAASEDDSSELIALEYAGGNRRLVPVHEAARLWRYGADKDAVKLDKLDGSSWGKRRKAIDEALAASARELLRLARQREKLEAPVIEPDSAGYERFVGTFPFNETADQARAIQAVRDDLASGRPMDRLIIGDVGYGKTEVALRAAALTALAGYQVIVAAPTTVLVRQHLQTFQRRFAGLNIEVAGLSRLSSSAEKKATKTGLADGTISIVIGTAAIMGKDIHCANLGLVVIDEEQRFGTADKKKFRGRSDVHLLAMSATPIPRTLHRAMIGLQQMSVIATPPARRQAIRTSVVDPDDATIRTALMRERTKGGQSFVVVPRIEDLGPLSDRLARIVPDLEIIAAHGKMPAAEIDEAMVRFGDGFGDVLLATNIIEAGLDVPRANTMLIWRADCFGLAQLHQLRGRVGRGTRRGQVFLLTESGKIGEQTIKRLRTLATYDHLGSGFEISAADLDQRGAGDLLADAQAGHMKLIGVDLYQHLFEAALKQARGEDPGLWVPDLNLGEAGSLPPDWIPDANIRLGLYIRLSRLSEGYEIEALEEELVDRFGPLPRSAERLIEAARIAILARMAGIERIDAGPAAIALTPRCKERKLPGPLDLSSKDGRWILREQTADDTRVERVSALLESLAMTSS